MFLCLFNTACQSRATTVPTTQSLADETQTIQTQSSVSDSTHTKETSQTTETVAQSPVNDHLITLKIQPAWQLERDIVPAIAKAFSIDSETVIETLLALPQHELMPPEVEGLKRIEGLILAGSYNIEANSDLNTWLNERIKETTALLQEYASDLTEQNTLTPRERLSLAALIQAETLGDPQYEQVAAVFLNRLNQGDKLQACSTAEYEATYQRPYLLYKEMDLSGPYNTYLNHGLPPGPICSPTHEALLAASQTSQNTELYFFFYDYMNARLRSYADYIAFAEEGAEAYQSYAAEGPTEPEDTINKQELFGLKTKHPLDN